MKILKHAYLCIVAISFFSGCQATTTGSIYLNNEPAKVELTEVFKSNGILVDGFSLTVNDNYIGDFICDPSCSAFTGQITVYRPIETDSGTFTMSRRHMSTGSSADIALNGKYLGTIQF